MAEAKPACSQCGTKSGTLFLITCSHFTVCHSCGKSMAQRNICCSTCGTQVTRLVMKEYAVKLHPSVGLSFLGRFAKDAPVLSKKKNPDMQWVMQREGASQRQLTDAARERLKMKPWNLEDDLGRQVFQGQLEGGQNANYYVLLMQGDTFLVHPAGQWYNFHKMVSKERIQKQLTLEEAEDFMKRRRLKTEERKAWMMNTANTGAAAFADIKTEGVSGQRKVPKEEVEEGDEEREDRGAESEGEEEARRERLGMNKKPDANNDEEEAGPAEEEPDLDEDPDRGEDWEHEETFTDDDEAPGNPDDDLAAQEEGPAPPPPRQLKEETEEEAGEEGQGLSDSGKELRKLLGRTTGLDDDEEEDDDEDDDEDVEDLDEEVGGEDFSHVLLAARNEAVGGVESASPAAAGAAVPTAAAPAAAVPGGAGKGKRKEAPGTSAATAATAAGGGAPTPASAGPPTKRAKTAPEVESAVITEEDVRKVIRDSGPIKTADLVAKFKKRINKRPENKTVLPTILKKISRIQKISGVSYVVLR